MSDEFTIEPGTAEPDDNSNISIIPGDDPSEEVADAPAEESGDFKAAEEKPVVEEEPLGEDRKERYEEDDKDKELFEL